MRVYEFRREREIAITLQQDGSNLPGGLLWEPSSVVEATGLRDDILEVIESVGFFVWA
jgi:hypothetical protein